MDTVPAEIIVDVADASHGRRDATPSQLHGLASSVLGETDEEHRRGRKPWSASITRMTPDRFTLRIGWLAVEPVTAVMEPPDPTGRVLHALLDARMITTTYKDMLAEPARHVAMEFVSPTLIKRNGVVFPFPEPATVFGQLVERWNLYCPGDQRIGPGDKTTLLDALDVTAWSGRTGRIDLGREKGSKVGFVGRMVVELNDAARDHTPFWLGGLARFAELAGAGAETPFGAGRVRVVR